MRYRQKRLNQEIKAYDPDLRVLEIASSLEVHRRAKRFLPYELSGKSFKVCVEYYQPILYLTDTWTVKGNPVDWGIEPILARLKEMDQWRDDSTYEKLTKERESAKYWEERELRNNLRATALDSRREFARATNDINTSIVR